MEAYYLYLKTAHLIAAVFWFFGLYATGRLLYRHANTEKTTPPDKEILSENYKVMTAKIWNNTAWPAMILTVFFGIWVVSLRTFYLSDAWVQVKLILIVLLVFIHLRYHKLFKKQQRDENLGTPIKVWVLNLLPPLLFVSIIFLGILRHSSKWLVGVVFFILMVMALTLGKKFIKKKTIGV